MARGDFNNDLYDASETFFVYTLISTFPRLFLRPLYALMFVLCINQLFSFGWWNITPNNTPESPFWMWGIFFLILFIPTEFGRW